MMWVFYREGGGGMGSAGRWLLPMEADQLNNQPALPQNHGWHRGKAPANHFGALLHQRCPAQPAALAMRSLPCVPS